MQKMIFNPPVIFQDILRVSIDLSDHLIDNVLSSWNLSHQRNTCRNNGLVLQFLTEFIPKHPPLPLVMLKVHVPYIVKVVRNDKCEHNPSILLLNIDPKEDQKHDQFGNQSDLNYRVKPQEPYVVVHLQIVPI